MSLAVKSHRFLRPLSARWRTYSLNASVSFRGVKKAPTLGTILFSRLRLGSCTAHGLGRAAAAH